MSTSTQYEAARAYAKARTESGCVHNFATFTSRETILEAHAAHLRILARIAARKAAIGGKS